MEVCIPPKKNTFKTCNVVFLYYVYFFLMCGMLYCFNEVLIFYHALEWFYLPPPLSFYCSNVAIIVHVLDLVFSWLENLIQHVNKTNLKGPFFLEYLLITESVTLPQIL